MARGYIADKADRMLDRIVCVVGAVFGAQAPAFMHQYLQRLGGHLEEAKRHLAEFENVARQGGVTLQQFIANSSKSPDPNMTRIGDLITRTQERVNDLSAAQVALREAAVWERPTVLARHFDSQVWKGTWVDFQPAVPTTGEGLVYACIGIAVALALYSVLIHPLFRLGRKRPEEIPAPQRV